MMNRAPRFLASGITTKTLTWKTVSVITTVVKSLTFSVGQELRSGSAVQF